jgi:hypothetical protein
MWWWLTAGALAEPVDAWLDAVVVVRTGGGLCSGVRVDPQGTVVTAYHCVATGRKTTIQDRSGQQGAGHVVGLDPANDLAVLETDVLGPWLELRGEPAEIGETVWGLGHPHGDSAQASKAFHGTLMWSASRGVVSAVGPRLVQTDAALNPGNSGGPVVDDQGRIVGITSRKLRADNIAFAIPADLADDLVQDPIKHRPTGGTYSLGATAWTPARLSVNPSVGVRGEVWLRDRIGVEGGVAAGVGTWRTALAVGDSSWIGGHAMLNGRARFGSGRWSTTLDVGGGALFQPSLAAQVSGDRIYAAPGPLAVLPGGQLRVGAGGAALRVTGVWTGTGPMLTVGIDLDWPGVLGAF